MALPVRSLTDGRRADDAGRPRSRKFFATSTSARRIGAPVTPPLPLHPVQLFHHLEVRVACDKRPAMLEGRRGDPDIVLGDQTPVPLEVSLQGAIPTRRLVLAAEDADAAGKLLDPLDVPVDVLRLTGPEVELPQYDDVHERLGLAREPRLDGLITSEELDDDVGVQ